MAMVKVAFEAIKVINAIKDIKVIKTMVKAVKAKVKAVMAMVKTVKAMVKDV